MNPNYTHASIILDRSGSMCTVVDDCIGGFNLFIRKQRDLKLGKFTVSLVQFDHEYLPIYDFVDIYSVADLNRDNYYPRGSTALLDAMGKTINETGAKLAAMKEEDRPSKVIIITITDGEENYSQLFTPLTIKNMIEHQKQVYSWEFVYLMNSPNVYNIGESLGISRKSILNYSSTNLFGANLTPGEYVIRAFDAINSGVSCRRQKESLTSGTFFSDVGLEEDEDHATSNSK